MQINDKITCYMDLQKVIEGEQGGISKLVDWQGGGSFVYCELLEDAQSLISEIQEANHDQINLVKNKIYKDYKIVPYITKQELASVDSSFEELSLEDKKKIRPVTTLINSTNGDLAKPIRATG